jgi:hypothetical protein
MMSRFGNKSSTNITMPQYLNAYTVGEKFPQIPLKPATSTQGVVIMIRMIGI